MTVDAVRPKIATNLDRCLYCDEPLSLADTEPNAIERLLHSDEMGSDLHTGQRCHRVCLFRSVSGSVAHIEGRCGCFVPGSSERDDPGLTRLQAAEAALAAFRRRRHEELRCRPQAN